MFCRAAARRSCCCIALLLAALLPRTVLAQQFSEAELDAFAEEVRRDGFTLIPSVLPPAKLRAMRAAFRPVLAKRMLSSPSDRGPARYYATPPFVPPFWDPDVFAHPAIVGVVARLVGADAVLCQFAVDTPLNGSALQDVHRDAAPLFPEQHRHPAGAAADAAAADAATAAADEPPAAQLAVNFPLVDVLPATGNGPTEVAAATHRLTLAQAKPYLEAFAADCFTTPADCSAETMRLQQLLQPVYMRLGDVLLRDVRGLHRGTPNHSAEPREMVVMGYSRAWLRRPEVALRVKQSLYDGLRGGSSGAVARALLRFEERVPDAAFEHEYDGRESYDAAVLGAASGGSYRGVSVSVSADSTVEA